MGPKSLPLFRNLSLDALALSITKEVRGSSLIVIMNQMNSSCLMLIIYGH